MLTHSKAKPYKCPCDCKSAFSRGSSLGKHIERVHNLPRDSPLTIAATTRSKKGKGKKCGPISGWDRRCEETQSQLRSNLESIANNNPPIVYHKNDDVHPLRLPIYPQQGGDSSNDDTIMRRVRSVDSFAKMNQKPSRTLHNVSASYNFK
eukprot:TRINITY_DN2831_c0_g1_i1.p1 TRINITY_DN2831_c0_g1~~TRINITY_DN2831_c0_g1_i1.p1  ORF type:complete len:150 (+),score=12.14 TRINITY_DN2831_c0_g1_i1:1003-1452(+)